MMKFAPLMLAEIYFERDIFARYLKIFYIRYDPR